MRAVAPLLPAHVTHERANLLGPVLDGWQLADQRAISNARQVGAQRASHLGEPVDAMVAESGRHGCEEPVWHVCSVLIGGVHRRVVRDRILAPTERRDRRPVVQRAHAGIPEEARGVRRLAGDPSEPQTSSDDQPSPTNAARRYRTTWAEPPRG